MAKFLVLSHLAVGVLLAEGLKNGSGFVEVGDPPKLDLKPFAYPTSSHKGKGEKRRNKKTRWH